jgi:hypothetical protein
VRRPSQRTRKLEAPACGHSRTLRNQGVVRDLDPISTVLGAQSTLGNQAVLGLLNPQEASVRSPASGAPLPHRLRGLLEVELGRSVADLRIHADVAAGRAATALGASAFTLGRDLYFGPGRYQPDTIDGTRLIAHEASHAVQQQGATRLRKGLSRSADADEQAAGAFSSGFVGRKPSQGWRVRPGQAQAVVQRAPLRYPTPIVEPVNEHFIVVGGDFSTPTFVVTDGSEVQLLVEGDPQSTVQLRAPFAHAHEPFAIPNERLSHLGPPALPSPAPTPTNQEVALTPIVEGAALAEGMPTPILKGLVFRESSWRPNAVSPTGPVGLVQLARATAQSLGLSVATPDERLDPAKAAPAGARYLRDHFDHFPEAENDLERWRFALAAYNQGRGAVNGAIRSWMAAAGATGTPPPGTLRWADVASSWGNAEGVGYVRAILGEAGSPGGVAATRYGYGR